MDGETSCVGFFFSSIDPKFVGLWLSMTETYKWAIEMKEMDDVFTEAKELTKVFKLYL